MAKKVTETKPSSDKKTAYRYASGKRKTAIARVRLVEGKGDVIVNGKDIKDYFFGNLIANIKTPFRVTGTLKTYDVEAYITGGGIAAQSDALRHGIARVLVELDPAHRTALKQAGLLTRDSRVKERKKYGLHRARRAPQFSKR